MYRPFSFLLAMGPVASRWRRRKWPGSPLRCILTAGPMRCHRPMGQARGASSPAPRARSDRWGEDGMIMVNVLFWAEGGESVDVAYTICPNRALVLPGSPRIVLGGGHV